MKCKDTIRRLPEFVSGELSEAERTSVSAHLEGCESCRAERAGYEDALGALAASTKRVDPPASMDRLRLDAPRRPAIRPAFAAAALCALLVLGAVAFICGRTPGRPSSGRGPWAACDEPQPVHPRPLAPEPAVRPTPRPTRRPSVAAR